MTTQPTVSTITLQDICGIVWRRRNKCLLVFCTIMVLALGVLFFTKKAYRSEAKLFVRLGRENVTADPTTSPGQSMSAFPLSRDSEIASVLEILQSRSVIESAVDKVSVGVVLEAVPPISADSRASDAAPTAAGPGLMSRVSSVLQAVGLADPLSEREQAIQKVLKLADVQMLKKSAVISVTYDARTPEEAQQIVSALAEACQDQHIRANRPRGSYQFLSDQSDVLKSRLKDAENQLRDAKDKTGLASPGDQRQILVQRIGKLEDESLQNEALLTAHNAQLSEMKRALADVSPESVTARTVGFPNMAADSMRSQLYALQVKEKELLSKFSELHPDVRAIRDQIKQAEAIVNEQEPSRVQETKGPNHIYEVAKAALLAEEPIVFSLQAKAKAVSNQIADAKSTLKTLNENEVQIARLQREMELAEAKYRKYSENVEQARLDEALGNGRLSNLTLAQAATLDPKPVKPRRLLVLGLGSLLAVLAAAATAFVGEYRQRTAEPELEVTGRLSLPTLAPLPTLEPRNMALYSGDLQS